MDSCDVLIVGGGPAGSTCAWRLRDAGLDVALVDKEPFPRDKVCGGWVTPAVFHTLGVSLDDYRTGRVLQPVTRFLTSIIGGPTLETSYSEPVSYGIWRREFDQFLLDRAAVRVLEPRQIRALHRDRKCWLVNNEIRAKLVVGAGGHFCPVARYLGSRPSMEHSIHAQEAEWEMDIRNADMCSVRGNTPELFFNSDMRGYGWCFRKGRRLNVGFGRLNEHHLSKHATEFRDYLQNRRCINTMMPASFRGHAYLLRSTATRPCIADGLMLVGDAAGLAFSASGEGILPAVESGILAADVILAANGEYDERTLSPYADALTVRFGPALPSLSAKLAGSIPSPLLRAMLRRLMRHRGFVEHIVLDRWFLHKSRRSQGSEGALEP